MKIELTSEFYKSEDLFQIIEYYNSEEIKYELEAVNENDRAVETAILVAIIGSFGFGRIVSAFIGAMKDIKIQKLKQEQESKEKANDRIHDISQHKIERDTEFKKLILQGIIDIEKERIQIEGSKKERLILDDKTIKENLIKLGADITDDRILLPINMKEEDLLQLDKLINVFAVKEIIHRNK